MSKWKTEKHFTSWLCLSPNNKKTGGKILKTRTKKTKNRATNALRMAAKGLVRSDSYIGAFNRRLQSRLGPSKAITATAHKLAKIIYHMLKYQVEYIDLGAEFYEEKYRKRVVNNLKSKAVKFGFELVPLTNCK